MKEILKRGLLGMPIGVTIGAICNVIVSIYYNTGTYMSCSPFFEEKIGSNLGASVIQLIVTAIMGFVLSGSSVVWDIEKWSILKSTVVAYTISLLTGIIPAIYLRWTPLEFAPIFGFALVWTGIYFAIWIGNYLYYRKRVKCSNADLKKLTK